MDVIVPLSLPPETSFNPFESLYTAAQKHVKLAGYAFVIGKSEKRKGSFSSSYIAKEADLIVVGCTTRIKEISIRINDYILTKGLKIMSKSIPIS
jgi:hypothetical protein